MYIYVCVCVWEVKSERARESERERGGERERERERGRERMREREGEREMRSAAKYKLVGYRPAGSLSSCCHGDAQVNLTWANSHRHTDARYAIPLFIWFLHDKTYFATRFSPTAYSLSRKPRKLLPQNATVSEREWKKKFKSVHQEKRKEKKNRNCVLSFIVEIIAYVQNIANV